MKWCLTDRALTRVLAEQGLYLSELTPLGIDLETVFLDLTKEQS